MCLSASPLEAPLSTLSLCDLSLQGEEGEDRSPALEVSRAVTRWWDWFRVLLGIEGVEVITIALRAVTSDSRPST